MSKPGRPLMRDGRDRSTAGPLPGSAAASQPDIQRLLLRGLHRLPLPMPRTTRELFELLALYEPSEGFAALLDRIDVSEVRPHQVYRVVHGRAPEIELSVPSEGYNPREQIRAAVLSQEFRETLLARLLLAFPEKHREVFIHIPNSCGTDLILNLGASRLCILKILEEARGIPEVEFLDGLRAIARAMPYYDTVFICGDMLLGNYLKIAMNSAAERIFTIIRDPFELMLSQANSAVSCLRRDPGGQNPDTQEILAALKIARLPNPPTLCEMRDLAVRALRCPEIVRPNSICFHLGDDGMPTYEAAMQNLIMYDVEVLTTAHCTRWLAQRWGLQSTTHHDPEDHWIEADDIDAETAEILVERSAEDQKLFDVVAGLLERKGTLSIRGSEIAEALSSSVGGQLADLASAPTVGRRPVRNPGGSTIGRRAATEAVGGSAIETFLRDNGKVEPMFAMGFGVRGDLDRYGLEGWAAPEPEFAWTCATRARMEVPKPVFAGDYRLRLTLSPYVVRDKLAAQRIITIVNGIILGETAISDSAIIEYELPAAVLGGETTMSLLFILPDAARPCDVTGADDRRLLAVAFKRIELLCCDDLVPEPREVAAAGAAQPDAEPADDGRLADSRIAGGLPDLHDLMMGFESLGENCEFGLVQRRCGAEPLGLFRFASAPLPKLMMALEARFHGLADAANLQVQLSLNGREFMVEDRRFGFLYHAWVLAGEMPAEQIHAREVSRLPFLIRKLIEDLELGEKIFVYHGMEPMTTDAALDLFAMLRRFGPNTLLWVEPMDSEHPAGSVEWIAPGLLKAYIDRLAPAENAHDLSLDCWITICREAARLRRPAFGHAADD